MCIGKPGRGKSTAIILASKLVSEENVSRVAPSDAEGFMLETMIGKLINIDTDIPTDERIPDHFLKKVEDRQPFLVNRKNRRGVMGMLPAVHIYGANDLPPTRERSVGAYDRRWSFNIFDQFDVPMEEHNKDIVEDIVNAGMAGVLNFAVEGLRDILHNKGKFYQSSEMKTAIKDWQKSNDFVQQFLDDLWSGEFTQEGAALGPKIERLKMWNLYQDYFKECYPDSKNRLGKNKFYEILTVQKGLNVGQDSAGRRYFVKN
jgi:phage/plasmid-associated DNA primase